MQTHSGFSLGFDNSTQEELFRNLQMLMQYTSKDETNFDLHCGLTLSYDWRINSTNWYIANY